MDTLITEYSGWLFMLLMFAIIAIPAYVNNYYDKSQYRNLGLPTKHKYSIKYPAKKRSNKFLLRFRKITVILPKQLPNMYLDCHVEQKTQKQAILIDPKQQIELEGDFYKSYTLFAPENARVLALEIFTPNIMESLLQAKLYCDIEIKNNKLIFLSIRSDIKDVKDFIKIISPLVMKIDHKMTTWSKSNQKESKSTALRLSKASQIKIGSRYYDLRHISSVVTILLCALIAVITSFLISDIDTRRIIYILLPALCIYTIVMVYFFDSKNKHY